MQLSQSQIARAVRTSQLWDKNQTVQRLVNRRIRQFDTLGTLVTAKCHALIGEGRLTEAEWLSDRYRKMHSRVFDRVTAKQDALLNEYRSEALI